MKKTQSWSKPMVVQDGIMTESEYRTLHQWVRYHRGKPNRFEKCGDSSERRYHWANISGEYKRDLADFERLCVPCHFRADGMSTYNGESTWKRELCIEGHKQVISNLYLRKHRYLE